MTFIMYSLVLLILIVLIVGWQNALKTKDTVEKLRSELLQLCLGDKQLAGRLVMREVKRQPNLTTEQAVRAAIASYQRDH